MAKIRGADVLAKALVRAGVRRLFSLSGNHIMSVYDAALDAGLDVVHTRHEAAAVHMADAWGRLTSEPGVALLTGGPGHANGLSALYTALASESPLVLLSGQAPLVELQKGAFQEMRQADMAEPVVKAAFTASSAFFLGDDLARAWRQAKFGRPGPVYLGLPVDVLEEKVDDDERVVPEASAFALEPISLGDVDARAVLAELAIAKRPLILTGPSMATDEGRDARRKLEEASGVPVLCMESPRGINDPSLGAFPEVLAQADLIILLGKRLDFTLRYGQPPAVAANCRFILLDPEAESLRKTRCTLNSPLRIALGALADPFEAARQLARLAGKSKSGWVDEVRAAVRHRPAEWSTVVASSAASVHPAELGRAVQRLVDQADDAVLIADGGEFGQWAQACVSAPTRIINGPAGAIGSSLPFAISTKLARPSALVVAMLGDGTFGFHMAEFDTAVRTKLPFVAIIGNDRCWNAEHQIQLRAYGAKRAHSCELLPTRYDQVVAALGGHGEHVDQGADLAGALDRAVASGLPACVNVAIERLPAPVVHG